MPDSVTMKHIGMMAHSAEGAALCFQTICREAQAILGGYRHPDVTLSIIAMGPSLDAWARGDYPAIRAVLAETARRLAAAGCDFFVCPDNTAHLVLETEGEPLALPGLHIAEVVADAAVARGFRCIGLLGTRWTMEGAVYPRVFQRSGLDLRIPPAGDRTRVDQIIFEELCEGRILDASRNEYVQIIERLAQEGCEAVVLGCTEIPLLVSDEVSPIPGLDSTRLLARRALDVALGRAPFPSWRGGARE